MHHNAVHISWIDSQACYLMACRGLCVSPSVQFWCGFGVLPAAATLASCSPHSADFAHISDLTVRLSGLGVLPTVGHSNISSVKPPDRNEFVHCLLRCRKSRC